MAAGAARGAIPAAGPSNDNIIWASQIIIICYTHVAIMLPLCYATQVIISDPPLIIGECHKWGAKNNTNNTRQSYDKTRVKLQVGIQRSLPTMIWLLYDYSCFAWPSLKCEGNANDTNSTLKTDLMIASALVKILLNSVELTTIAMTLPWFGYTVILLSLDSELPQSLHMVHLQSLSNDSTCCRACSGWGTN